MSLIFGHTLTEEMYITMQKIHLCMWLRSTAGHPLSKSELFDF